MGVRFFNETPSGDDLLEFPPTDTEMQNKKYVEAGKMPEVQQAAAELGVTTKTHFAVIASLRNAGPLGYLKASLPKKVFAAISTLRGEDADSVQAWTVAETETGETETGETETETTETETGAPAPKPEVVTDVQPEVLTQEQLQNRANLQATPESVDEFDFFEEEASPFLKALLLSLDTELPSSHTIQKNDTGNFGFVWFVSETFLPRFLAYIEKVYPEFVDNEIEDFRIMMNPDGIQGGFWLPIDDYAKYMAHPCSSLADRQKRYNESFIG